VHSDPPAVCWKEWKTTSLCGVSCSVFGLKNGTTSTRWQKENRQYLTNPSSVVCLDDDQSLG
jgi:hypothetical protein